MRASGRGDSHSAIASPGLTPRPSRPRASPFASSWNSREGGAPPVGGGGGGGGAPEGAGGGGGAAEGAVATAGLEPKNHEPVATSRHSLFPPLLMITLKATPPGKYEIILSGRLVPCQRAARRGGAAPPPRA